MRLLLAANNQATRRNEIIKSYLQLGSSSNRYAPRLPQQETKSSTKQLPPTGPILGPENILKTGFAQKGLPSIAAELWLRGRYQKCRCNRTVVTNDTLETVFSGYGQKLYYPASRSIGEVFMLADEACKTSVGV